MAKPCLLAIFSIFAKTRLPCVAGPAWIPGRCRNVQGTPESIRETQGPARPSAVASDSAKAVGGREVDYGSGKLKGIVTGLLVVLSLAATLGEPSRRAAGLWLLAYHNMHHVFVFGTLDRSRLCFCSNPFEINDPASMTAGCSNWPRWERRSGQEGSSRACSGKLSGPSNRSVPA